MDILANPAGLALVGTVFGAILIKIWETILLKRDRNKALANIAVAEAKAIPKEAREARETIRKYMPALAMRLDYSFPVEDAPKPPTQQEKFRQAFETAQKKPVVKMYTGESWVRIPEYSTSYDPYTQTYTGYMRHGDKVMAQRMSKQMYEELNSLCNCDTMIETGNGDRFCYSCGEHQVWS